MPDTRFDLSGRTIVVTGASGQLGRAYTAYLAGAGANVAALDRAPLEQSLPDNVLFFDADVTNRKSLAAALAGIEEAWGQAPHGLINNAGLDSPPDADARENGPFETFPVESFERVMSVNATGPLLCCQVFGGAMAAAGRGSIVNIGSTYGLVSPDQRLYEYRRAHGETFYKPVAYSVSKSAILNLTRYLATYWGPDTVRVNTLTLGGVFAGQDERFLEAYNSRVPLGRMAEPEDYFGALHFLLSDASRYMTGANMVVDGGWTAW
jgi:NAD(P)-dependent dehydrogenase (short-subunit alcohol dehydrogenase family)